jgi:hypothetical protein
VTDNVNSQRLNNNPVKINSEIIRQLLSN